MHPIFFFFVQKKMALGTLSAVIPNDIVNYPYTTPHVEGSFKIATAFYLFAYGIYLMLLPISLRYDYSYNQIPAVDFGSPLAILGLLIFFAGVYFTIKLLWNRKMMGIPLAIFYLSLGPALAFTVEGLKYGESLGSIAGYVAPTCATTYTTTTSVVSSPVTRTIGTP